jgi:amino acid permease
LVTADQHEKIIALGSNIGSGLFIGTGKALAYGGPGNMIVAYLIVCSGVWANVQALIEMTIMFPTSGNFIDYAGRWVDPAVAFGAGFAEWLGMTVTSLRIGLEIGTCADRLIRMDGGLWRRGRVFLHTDQLLG